MVENDEKAYDYDNMEKETLIGRLVQLSTTAPARDKGQPRRPNTTARGALYGSTESFPRKSEGMEW